MYVAFSCAFVVAIPSIAVVATKSKVQVGVVAARANTIIVTYATAWAVDATCLFVLIVVKAYLAYLAAKVNVHIRVNTVYAGRALFTDTTLRTGRCAFVAEEIDLVTREASFTFSRDIFVGIATGKTDSWTQFLVDFFRRVFLGVFGVFLLF